KADMLPFYETARTETPTPVNPLGVKGAGETGTIASTPAVVNAVVDALSGLGVDQIEEVRETRHVSSPVRVPHAGDGEGGAGPARAPQGRRQAAGGRAQPAAG